MSEESRAEKFLELFNKGKEFTEELLKALVEQGAVYQIADRWECRVSSPIELPHSVRSVVGQRVSRLGLGTQELLRLASVIGPTVGGYITDSIGWQWVFYVNLPVGIVALAVVVVLFPHLAPSRQQATAIDWLTRTGKWFSTGWPRVTLGRLTNANTANVVAIVAQTIRCCESRLS